MLFAGCSEKSQNENKNTNTLFFPLVFIDLDFRATAKNSASVENYHTCYQYNIIARLEF